MLRRILQNIIVSICIIAAVIAVIILYSRYFGFIETEPTITITAEIRSLSDAEYQEVGTAGVENPTKEDFKRFVFQLDVEHTRQIKSRRITVPAIKEPMNLYDNNHRYWFGKSYAQDNKGENFAHYGEDFVFYSRGLDAETIKSIYKSQEVTVSWVRRDGKRGIRTYSIGDILEFK